MTFWQELHHAIQTTLKQEIPSLQTCMAYPTQRKTLLAPAVFIELDHLEPGHDPGTEELALRLKFEARVVVDALVPDAHLIVRALASEVAHVVHMNTWGLPVSPGRFLGAYPDGFKPELDAYLVWNVTWVHEVHQGINIWPPFEVLPHTIQVGLYGAGE